MTNQEKVNKLLEENNFKDISVKTLTKALLQDMENGLSSEFLTNPSFADEPMIVASRSIPHQLPPDSQTIVIDAGGTNFRSCLVTIGGDGKVSISNLEKTLMPAVNKELSKEEFYDAIAKNLEHLKNMSNRIGFCFSYAMEITKTGDGKVLKFSKEIKAPEVIGTLVGEELKKALIKNGWQPVEKIMLVNDTMASLLSGILSTQNPKEYSSFIGLILGTGLNSAYIDYNTIGKLSGDNSKEHIIVSESGMFGKQEQSRFDELVDKNSTQPGASKLEKMCSGAYLGHIAYYAVKAACENNLFSQQAIQDFSKLSSLLPYDMDQFLNNPTNDTTLLGSMVYTGDDREILTLIFNRIITRAAQIVAAILMASILKSGKGTKTSEPVCIVGNGTTFWKTHNLFNQITQFMNQNLTEEWQRYYKIISVENDIILGTTAAAFI